MRVIITGGGGFLGQRLCRELLIRGALTGESGVEEPVEEIVLFDSYFSRGGVPADGTRHHADPCRTVRWECRFR
jgi:nucleoside-diphosphate-sugar epimerase